MHFQNGLTSTHIGLIHNNLTIKTSGAKERRVEHVGTVRRRNDNNAFIGRKAIHLHEQLIERLFTLIVPPAKPGTTLAPDGIDLINEYDTGRRFLRLFEEVTHTRCTNANEHLNKI